MGRVGTNDKDANQAVELYCDLLESNGWELDKSWLAIVQLLMTCKVWESGAWQDFHGLPVVMGCNNYKIMKSGMPNQDLRDAERIANFLAGQLQISPAELCGNLGLFFEHPDFEGYNPTTLGATRFGRSWLRRFRASVILN